MIVQINYLHFMPYKSKMVSKNNLFFAASLFLILQSCGAQKTYQYQMALQSKEIGYYYIKYSSEKTDSTELIVIDRNGVLVSCEITLTSSENTVKAHQSSIGRYTLKQNQINSPLCISIVKEGTKFQPFNMCVIFWEWNEEQSPKEIVVVLGEEDSSVIHITSDIPLLSKDLQKIKDKIMRDDYGDTIFKHVKIQRIIYF